MARSTFNPAIGYVLAHEGGYVNDPKDKGGPTNLGITQATLAAWFGHAVSADDVRHLTRWDATAIYRAEFWDRIRGDLLPAGLDYALFDFAVNSGAGRAARFLQTLLKARGLYAGDIDGGIGAKNRPRPDRPRPTSLRRSRLSPRSAVEGATGEPRDRRRPRGRGRAGRRPAPVHGAPGRPGSARGLGGRPGAGCPRPPRGRGRAGSRPGRGSSVTLPAPDRHALARQVDLLRAMGGAEPVRGYSTDEQAAVRDRIAAVLGRVSGTKGPQTVRTLTSPA